MLRPDARPARRAVLTAVVAAAALLASACELESSPQGSPETVAAAWGVEPAAERQVPEGTTVVIGQGEEAFMASSAGPAPAAGTPAPAPVPTTGANAGGGTGASESTNPASPGPTTAPTTTVGGGQTPPTTAPPTATGPGGLPLPSPSPSPSPTPTTTTTTSPGGTPPPPTTTVPGQTTTTTTAPTPTTTPTTTTSGPGFGPGSFFVDNSHPNASDSNAGTSENAPWRTIVHAAATVQHGETVYVKRGVYDDGEIELLRSGRNGSPIVLRTYPGHERQVEVTRKGFVAEGRSDFEIRDFKITHTDRHGIRVEGPPDPYAPPARRILISGNHTYHTCSSGISVWGVDWGEDPGDYDNIRDVDIEYNLLELGTTGCKGEIITVAGGAVNVDVRYNTIRKGDPAMKDGDEGIDFKEGVRDSRIYSNRIYDLSDKGIYIDGGSGVWDPQITNIQIFNNLIYDVPSAGISITTEGRGDVDGIDVFNNVVHGVDADAFIVYGHPDGLSDGGTVKNVRFFNNTAWNSGLRHGGHGGFRVNHPTATGIVFANNIAWGNNGYDIRGESETTIDTNLCRESFCEVRVDPVFANTGGHDFRLTPGSAAINAGSAWLTWPTDRAGVSRPQQGAIDLGAYEATG